MCWRAPPNGRQPVTISASTTPNDHTSVRWSSGFPIACSGDMYAAVPDVRILCEALALLITRAKPKSTIFATPRSVIMMFEGLISRWTI